MLQNLASQQSPPKEINKLSMEEIAEFMKIQYDPKRFVIRERFMFWSDMNRKPGESIPELAARIRQDAVNCDFQSIKRSTGRSAAYPFHMFRQQWGGTEGSL